MKMKNLLVFASLDAFHQFLYLVLVEWKLYSIHCISGLFSVSRRFIYRKGPFLFTDNEPVYSLGVSLRASYQLFTRVQSITSPYHHLMTFLSFKSCNSPIASWCFIDNHHLFIERRTKNVIEFVHYCW